MAKDILRNLISRYTKVNTRKENTLDVANIHGQTELFIKGFGKIAKRMDTEQKTGKMGEDTKVIGKMER